MGKHQPYAGVVPFLAVLMATQEAVTPSGGPGKKYLILQCLGQAGGTKAMWRDVHHPLSHLHCILQ